MTADEKHAFQDKVVAGHGQRHHATGTAHHSAGNRVLDLEAKIRDEI